MSLSLLLFYSSRRLWACNAILLFYRDPRSFAFIVREPEDLRERVLQFNLPEDLELEKYHKMSVVEFFAKQVAQSVQRVDYVSDSVSSVSSGDSWSY